MTHALHQLISGKLYRALFTLTCLIVLVTANGCTRTANVQEQSFRVLAYNVEFGRHATAERFGIALKPYNMDVITFNEVPGGDWVERVGAELDMPYHYTGTISSANHKDKYKAILSRTPLREQQEHELTGLGWNPASAVSATTRIGDRDVVIYSLHVAGASGGDAPNPAQRHIGVLIDRVLAADKRPLVILSGDFNDRTGEPVMDYCLNAGFRAIWQDLDLNVDRDSDFDTWQANGPAREGVIDHLLYRSEVPLAAVDGGILMLDPPLSDHHPVWAAFQIQAEK